MNILVTGGNGQLGLSLRKVAEEYPEHTFIFTDIPGLDITDTDAVSAMVERCGAGAIINCAAYTAVDRAELEPEQARRVNGEGPASLAAVALRHGIKLVHISTDYVFDGTAAGPLTENDAANPLNVYGRTKLDGERAVCASGADTAIIRTSWLYSEFGDNFVKKMLRLSGTRPVIEVVADQRGTPTYATDLARAVMKIIDNGIAGCEVYHYSGGGETTWHGFATEIFRIAGKSVELVPVTAADYSSAVARPAYSVLDKTKIIAAGAAVPDWRESLRECMKHYD